MLAKIKDTIRSWFQKRQESIILEVTGRCNLSCKYCYNVWKCDKPYPQGELDTNGLRRLIAKIADETRCHNITLTGGEPYLRADISELLLSIQQQGCGANVITNGVLLTEDLIKESIAAGGLLFEVQLPAADRRTVQKLMGADVYEDILQSIAWIRKHDGLVVVVFVATNWNLAELRTVMEICFALGVNGLMFNRFNPGGEGARHIEALLPPPEKIAQALENLNQWTLEFDLPVACSIVIHPCLIDLTKYPNLSFGFCAAGKANSYYTVDPLGNLRMCNHTPSILGNLLKESFSALTAPARIAYFTKAIPPSCLKCKRVRECQGGCKAAAESCYGDLWLEEPYLKCFGEGRRLF